MDLDLGNIWLALFVPFIITLVKQSGFDDRVNRLIAIGCYIVWAAAVTLSAGVAGVTWQEVVIDFLNNFAVTITVGTVTYQLILKQFGIDDKLTAATSFNKGPVEDVVIEG